MTQENDFFITYHGADQERAEWIARVLQEAGYVVELQSWDFWSNSSFMLEMFAISAIAGRTIALLSPEYLAEYLQRPEWAAAYAQDPTGERGILLPVRVRDCDVAQALPHTAYLDLLGLDDPQAAEKLLAGVKQRG